MLKFKIPRHVDTMKEEKFPPLVNPPKHVGIIMDGNSRWAKSHGKSRYEGHRAGTENLRRILRASVEFGVDILTIYAFSTENWNRSSYEVQGLMRILELVLDKELKELHEEGVQLRHIGKLDGLKPSIRKKVLDSIELTKNNDRLILNVAFNYGGRTEIVDAVKRIVKNNIPADEITEDLLTSYLDTGGLHDPDLIIRTSGEFRVSNFLIWQGAYSEYYISPIYWPEFDKAAYWQALYSFTQRERRYGARVED